MKKRLLSLFLVLVMLLTCIPIQGLAKDTSNDLTEEGSNAFSDVKEDDWFAKAVDYVWENDIFKGTSETIFSPNNGMTRAMFVTTLGRFAGVDISIYEKVSSFIDVDTDRYYAPYVAWAVENNITKGVGNQRFDPDGLVTREQMAVFAYNFFNAYDISPINITDKMPDDFSLVARWAEKAVKELYSAGILQGDDKGNFNPQDSATRAEAAAFFMNLAGKAPESKWIAKPEESINTGHQQYTIIFESNGGSEFSPVKVISGGLLSELPTPIKESYVFLGWYKDINLSEDSIFDETEPIKSNLTLYARYSDSALIFSESISEDLLIRDAAADGAVEPEYTVVIVTSNLLLTADDVLEIIKLESLNGTDDRMVSVQGENGEFTVYMEEGFNPGEDYQLSLEDNDELFFKDREESTRTFTFMVQREESNSISLNEEIIYIQANLIDNIMLEGVPVDSISLALYEFDEDSNPNAVDISGTFEYLGEKSLAVDDVLCIHSGVKPTTENTEDYLYDDIAYVKVTDINGTTISYTNVETEDVLPVGDTLPIYKGNVDTLDITDDKFSFDIDSQFLDFSSFTELGIENRDTVEVGDYIALYYTENLASATEDDVVLGRVIDSTLSNGTYSVVCETTTVDEIQSQFSFYGQTTLDPDELVGDPESIQSIEADIKRQTLESGIVNELANNYAITSLESDLLTDELGDGKLSVLMSDGHQATADELVRVFADNASSSKAKDKVKPSDVKVEVSLKTGNGHVGSNLLIATIKLSFDITFKNDEGDSLKLKFNVTFTQELGIGVDIYSNIYVKWYFCIPVFKNVVVGADLTFKTYTGVRLEASLTTISADTSKTVDVTEKIKSIIGSKDEKETADGVSGVYKIYENFLKNDLDYVNVVKKQLFGKDIPVLLGLIQVRIEVNFVVNVAANATIGCDISYQEGQKYSFRADLLNFSCSLNTYTVIDKVFNLDLYIIGNLGIEVGVSPEVKVGVFTTKLANAGLVAEIGVYIELYGFFSYNYSYNFSKDIKTSVAQGAMYTEFGIYFSASGKVEAGGKTKKIYNFYNNKWPLLTTNSQQYIYNFAYPQEDERIIINRNKNSLPDYLFKMIQLDLKDGKSTYKTFARDKFDIYFDNPAFKEQGGKIVVDTAEEYLESKMTVVWKSSPLAFTSVPIKRTFRIAFTSSDDLVIRHLLTVSVNDNILWSKRVEENSNVSDALPSNREILDLVDYDRYVEMIDGVDINLKYKSSGDGYAELTTGKVTSSLDFTYNLPLREYQIKVEDIEKDDGTNESRTYKAIFGQTFNINDLDDTGTNLDGVKYTKFVSVETQKDNEKLGIQPSTVINDEFAIQILSEDGKDYKYKAIYTDNSCTINYLFHAIDKSIPSQTELIKKGTEPTFDYESYVENDIGDLVYSVDGSFGLASQDREIVITCVPIDGYELILHRNGGSYDSSYTPPEKYIPGGGTILPTTGVISKDNSIFVGWYDNPEFTGNPITEPKGNLGPLHLYACFLPPQYKIRFEPNGGGGVMDDMIAEFDDSVVLNANKFVDVLAALGEITFIGWNTSPDGIGTAYSNEGIVHEPTDINSSGELILYAQWNESTKVDYQPEFGTPPKSGVINLSDAVKYSETYRGTITLKGSTKLINSMTLHDGVKLVGGTKLETNYTSTGLGSYFDDKCITIEEGSHVYIEKTLIQINIVNKGTLTIDESSFGTVSSMTMGSINRWIDNAETGYITVRNTLFYRNDAYERPFINNRGTMVLDGISSEYNNRIYNEGTLVMNNAAIANHNGIGVENNGGNLYMLYTSISANKGGIQHNGGKMFIINSLIAGNAIYDLDITDSGDGTYGFYSTFGSAIPSFTYSEEVTVTDTKVFNDISSGYFPQANCPTVLGDYTYLKYIQLNNGVSNLDFSKNRTLVFLDYSDLDKIIVGLRDSIGAYINITTDDNIDDDILVKTKLGGLARNLSDDRIGSYWN